MAFQMAVEIAAPADHVFAHVADVMTMPQWYSAVRSARHLGGGPGVGGRYEVVRELPGGPVRNEVEVTSFEPGREITLTSRTGPTPFVYRYVVDGTPDGSRVTLDGHISGEGLRGPAALLGGLAERLFSKGMKDNLEHLRRIIEAG
ncbi:SRPBCC family protein [Xylanimonas ulmi]|uniref:Polyketide cyclase/dehydrase/lipid transport protein n=1 Tax=Xylanimonas ulmi TaxID=228973 RepID=A0A4Q7M595_9MICO|nr:SRPBCC family protein [Xylanibacterium ulmi]RZS62591.1 polyketide cyclase/dehydrase/lipid transport protein [Xylanibacterium ulmi]